MSDQTNRRAKWMKLGALAGSLLALACNLLPPKYQEPCGIVAQLTSITCGAP
jgi:hypothetical protein